MKRAEVSMMRKDGCGRNVRTDVEMESGMEKRINVQSGG